jgi:peptidoglycan/LPS O-acetylase OafA/YrhL
MPRSPKLDGVRGLAILGVLAYHLIAFYGSAEPGSFGSLAISLASAGYLGVDLFFVLSGFLLGGILLDHRDAPNYYRVFYLRRAARILPLYAVWISLFYVARETVPADSPPHNLLLARPLPWWVYATLTQNFFPPVDGNVLRAGMLLPTWSLGVEEQ